jgi:hypothetical protein
MSTQREITRNRQTGEVTETEWERSPEEEADRANRQLIRNFLGTPPADATVPQVARVLKAIIRRGGP